tara:strand:+ start:237 stop:773 length:537 start_codon:yes stop_codon:yes gene_type:complete
MRDTILEQNTTKTKLMTYGLASIFSLALTSSEPQIKPLPPELQIEYDKITAEINSIIERAEKDPVGFVIDGMEDDPDFVVLSEKYGYYSPSYFAFSFEDSGNPEHNVKFGSKTILGHDKFGQSWQCTDMILSVFSETVTTGSLQSDSDGFQKIAFDNSSCTELEKGIIPRWPDNVFGI